MNNVLITGASGFIGSHLTEQCVQLGYKVKTFLHYNSRNDWGWLEYSKYKNEIEVISGDIRDFDSVSNAMYGCDTVFHLAALIGIPYSYVTPLAYIKTNIEGTYNVLQSAQMHKLENVLITSTSETYGTAQHLPINEKHPVVAQSPYAATKIAADELALSFFRSFNLPVKIVRPFNTYGPRQSARAIIPTIITQILNEQKVIKLGNVKPTRDFTFVTDTVNGFIEISKSRRLLGEIVNIGMNREIKIDNLVSTVAGLMNEKVEIQSDVQRKRPDSSEVDRLLCDNAKLVKCTNWKPQYNLENGLMETIKWFENNITLYKPDLYNM